MPRLDGRFFIGHFSFILFIVNCTTGSKDITVKTPVHPYPATGYTFCC